MFTIIKEVDCLWLELKEKREWRAQNEYTKIVKGLLAYMICDFPVFHINTRERGGSAVCVLLTGCSYKKREIDTSMNKVRKYDDEIHGKEKGSFEGKV